VIDSQGSQRTGPSPTRFRNRNAPNRRGDPEGLGLGDTIEGDVADGVGDPDVPPGDA
jgi:hypothetical protein